MQVGCSHFPNLAVDYVFRPESELSAILLGKPASCLVHLQTHIIWQKDITIFPK